MVRLWVHECGRVFCDRLNDERDCKKLFDQLYTSCRAYIKEDLFMCLKSVIPEEDLFENVGFEQNCIMLKEYIKFTDLHDGSLNSEKRGYDELLSTQMPELVKQLNDTMD